MFGELELVEGAGQLVNEVFDDFLIKGAAGQEDLGDDEDLPLG